MIAVRGFHTSKSQRSKQSKQFIIPIPLLKTDEIALKIEHKPVKVLRKKVHRKARPINSEWGHNTRHITRRAIPLFIRRKLVITTRQFHTSQSQRSKSKKQIVISIPFSKVDELAIHIEKKKRSRRARRTLSYRLKQAGSVAFIVIGILGLTFFSVKINHQDNASKLEPKKTFVTPTASADAKSKPQKYLPHSAPTHVYIDSVGIDAETISVGKAEDGTIEMPPLFDWVTGWYQYSPSPGEKGPAIIVGHVDTYKGISVFWHLRDVQPGDIVRVERADGKEVKFKVDALKQFDQANFPTDEVYGNIDHAGLRLITCGGAFDKSVESYTQNTVVYASMVQ